jgi:poly(beta-D-mannuronate) lyase
LNTINQSEKQTLIPDLISLAEVDSEAETALYLKLQLKGNENSQPSEILEIEAFGCKEDVSHNIELIDWYLSVPSDEDNNGKSDSIKETDLSDGYFDPRFFVLSEDAGVTFSTSVSGYKTSTNTKYVRSELREMLRRGNSSHKTQGVNQNNWVFSTAPQEDLDNAGGIDGQLNAELSVNSVTTTGEDYQIGRVIIGQIHANDDEPARLYYRKLPDNQHGSIYLAHELLDGDDTYYEIIGSRDNNASNPSNGIPLNEKFSYSITVNGHELTVTIIKADGTEFIETVDMYHSGYDSGGQYMYFKAGVYNQNNSGDLHDYVKATFYKIENSHTGY